MNRAQRIALLAAMTLASVAHADTPPPQGTWIGAGQGGLLLSSGNTSATSLNAKLDLARVDGPWKNVLFFGGLYGKSNGIVSGERIEARYRLDHSIDAHAFWFAGIDGVKDLFSGFAYQATASAGAGYKFIDSDATKLSGTLGLGYQRLEPQELVKDASGAVVQRINGAAQGNIVGTAGVDYAHTLTASTKLTDKLFVTSGSADTAATNDLAIAVSMSDRLALSLGYGVRYNTKPAAGVKKLDQVTTVNVVYNIK
jgi:putative salt-induced outer membrane protein